MMLDYKYENAEYYKWINRVVEYAEDALDVHVDLVGEKDEYIYEVNAAKSRVTVRGRTPPRDKLYILLHEVAHAHRMKYSAEDCTFFMDRSGGGNEREKLMTLMEEVLAWHQAEEIAEMLAIPIERRAWQRLINKTAERYLDWIEEEQ